MWEIAPGSLFALVGGHKDMHTISLGQPTRYGLGTPSPQPDLITGCIDESTGLHPSFSSLSLDELCLDFLMSNYEKSVCMWCM